jgi:TusE/DsrC/DsvC family sulfur relay protein
MNAISVNGKAIEVNEYGFLTSVDDWDEEVAAQLAEVEQITLTDRHWEVLHYLREYYRLHQIAPMIKVLVKTIGQKSGPERGNTKYLYNLFPAGPAKQACKIAGLPTHTGCV